MFVATLGTLPPRSVDNEGNIIAPHTRELRSGNQFKEELLDYDRAAPSSLDKQYSPLYNDLTRRTELIRHMSNRSSMLPARDNASIEQRAPGPTSKAKAEARAKSKPQDPRGEGSGGNAPRATDGPRPPLACVSHVGSPAIYREKVVSTNINRVQLLKLRQGLSPKPRQQRSHTAEVHPDQKGEVYSFFAKGESRLGDSCQWQHHPAAAAGLQA